MKAFLCPAFSCNSLSERYAACEVLVDPAKIARENGGRIRLSREGSRARPVP